jgi:carbamoyl-phosphate synthase large subunit
MPKREDIKKVLIIGSGPIIIGQACEFDYSGTQACKALKEEGLEVVLVNSNPATIMTDPQMADRTYIEPITPELVELIIEQDRPDSLLPTLGGQTGLNVAMDLYRNKVLEKFGIKVIGAAPDAIQKAEDREEFKAAMARIGLELPRSGIVRNMEEGRAILKEIGLPLIIRPSYTLGGTGGGVANTEGAYLEILRKGLELSPIHEVLVEESIWGWKEFELEVMRDRMDNVVIICSIENIDPMGIHTGDSITVAPAQTLTDKEYQRMRNAAIQCIREIGVDTGGSNIQFAINPKDGRMMIIEMNPRVSRSSALASKATGFPIAKIAAKLAIGYTLDELPNDITKKTLASFEPTIDYCVIKFPRFTFEKFPGADPRLTSSMKSVGETMAIGRTFKEAFQKGLRSLETGLSGFDGTDSGDSVSDAELKRHLREPCADRILFIKQAMLMGMGIDEVHSLSHIDPWFLDNLLQIVEEENRLKEMDRFTITQLSSDKWRKFKVMGFSDRYLARLWNTEEAIIRGIRMAKGVTASYKLVDTCAGEFEAATPYFYSTYDSENENRISDRRKVIILGGGPNRIGQGIEFDYCCVQAAIALRQMGIESIMINSNPETVSTDYDISDKLYFEPVTYEDVMNICDQERPEGVIIQFGGQTPLNLALALHRESVPILGTSPEAVDMAEDRDRFQSLLRRLLLKQPPNGIASGLDQASEIAERIGFPVLMRPSYVLGGRAMAIIHDEAEMKEFMDKTEELIAEKPILVDKFLEDATEIDIDAISDGKICIIAGIMEHIEEAGVHSGDSACVIPATSLTEEMLEMVRSASEKLALEMKVIGLMNVQMAIKGENLYILEVNPRASRTVPYVSKATGIPWVKLATRLMMGESLSELITEAPSGLSHVAVKESVLPFNRFVEVDPVLGPEMHSTGEVMGIDQTFPMAFAKSQMAAGNTIPTSGNAFISVRDKDKRDIVLIAHLLSQMGFRILATKGTHTTLKINGIISQVVRKASEPHPNLLDLLGSGKIHLVINTPSGKETRMDQVSIRRLAVGQGITYVTTLPAARALVMAIDALQKNKLTVRPIQAYHQK